MIMHGAPSKACRVRYLEIKDLLLLETMCLSVRAVLSWGVLIEDNVIIGAHSVVSGLVERNSVYAGNPAKRIMSIENYIEKRRAKQFEEAKEFCLKYKEAKGVFPDVDKLHEYFFLFTNGRSKLTPALNDKLKLCDNYEQSVAFLESHESKYASYEDFLKDISG